jgi:hypothetical protein
MIMATKQDYPSYLPDDFRGLESIQEGNQRYYYKREDGKSLLYGAIVGKRHMVIRYPEGSTIDVPPNSVGTEQIKDGAVEMEDLHNDVQRKLNSAVDQQTMTQAVNAAVGAAVPAAVSAAVKEADEESIRGIVKNYTPQS